MKLTREQIIDFTILSLRWYLAYYMFNYGLDKFVGGQFGSRSLEVLNTPLKEVGKFDLAWHLFSLDRTFDVVVGSVQMIGAILIVMNKTTLIGALLLLPVMANIFLIDLAFTTSVFGNALTIRLGCMILSDLFILLYYKDRIVQVWKNLTDGMTTKLNYKWWIFLILPIIGFLMDFVFGLFSIPIRLLVNWFNE